MSHRAGVYIRTVVFSLLALGLSVMILLALVEAGARTVVHVTGIHLPSETEEFADDNLSLHVFDPDLGWTLRPSYRNEAEAIYVNRQGMRMSTELQYEPEFYKRPRVLLLGDSMVFGLGVKQPFIFSELLNSELPDFQIINTGVSGYNNVQEDLMLRRLLPRVRPRLTILFFCEENDALTNDRTDNFYAYANLGSREPLLHPPNRKNVQPLYKRSYFWKLIQGRIQGRDLEYLQDRVDLSVRGENSYVMRLEKQIIADIAHVSRAGGTKLIVVDIPRSHQLFDRADDTRNRVLRAAARELNVEYINLREQYPSNRLELFLPNDTHWNEKGHRFVADVIKQIVIDETRSEETASQ